METFGGRAESRPNYQVISFFGRLDDRHLDSPSAPLRDRLDDRLDNRHLGSYSPYVSTPLDNRLV